MSSKRMRSGFTLIELLVVIAIIAILAAILFPVFAKAREKARQSACTNNQRQIAVAITMYAQDHNEVLPSAAEVWGALGLDKGVLKCPSKARVANGYVFNANASRLSLGAAPDPVTEVLTFDGNEKPTLANGLANVAYDHSEIDATRHSKKFIASYLDGHVEMTSISPFAVRWKDLAKTTVTYFPNAGSTLKRGASLAWDAGALSVQVLPAFTDGCVQFKVGQTTGNLVVGLQSSPYVPSDVNNCYNIDYCLYPNNTAKLYTMESGAYILHPGTYVANSTIFTVQRQDGTVTYWVDDTRLATSPTQSDQLLNFAVAYYHTNTLITDLSFYRYAKKP